MCYETLFKKLVLLKFSKQSIELLCNYLSERTQFVQIDDKRSNHVLLKYGVPQGSILGPILFNLYVTDLSDGATSNCLQFADDTTFYQSSKVKNLDICSQNLQTDLTNILDWSNRSNLAINAKKTKTMLFSTQQMSSRHNLTNHVYTIRCNGQDLERVHSMKLLGVTFSENLTWNVHVQNVTTAAYNTLRTLRKLKRLTDFALRKQLAEALVLSKINYGLIVYENIPTYLKRRLQKVQNSAAGYVCSKYAKENDVIRLNWLPVEEKIKHMLVENVHKSLYDCNWPKYLMFKRTTPARNLRSNVDNILVKRSYEIGTFEDNAAKVYNELPSEIKKEKSIVKFKRLTKEYFKNCALNKY